MENRIAEMVDNYHATRAAQTKEQEEIDKLEAEVLHQVRTLHAGKYAQRDTFKSAADVTEKQIRELAVAYFLATDSKTIAGRVQIRTKDKLVYSENRVRDWLVEHKLNRFLCVDKAAVAKEVYELLIGEKLAHEETQISTAIYKAALTKEG